jgi:diguanylate cyclase (GGDEF)-like protein/PAS domain S-box-containing protein
MSYFFNNSSEGLAFHINGTITDVNPALGVMFGYSTHELIGSNVFQWISPQYHALVKQQIANSSESQYEIAILHRSGKEIPVYLRPIETVVEGQRERLVAIQEISALKQEQQTRRRLEAQLHTLSNFDPHTTLPNRHLFNRWVLDMSELHHVDKHRFAVVHITFERMDVINEIFGREVGDQLVNQCATRLRRGLRHSSPHLSARIGGIRFAVALPYIKDQRSVIRLMENIRAELDAPYQVGEHRIDNLASSYGVAFFPEDSVSGETLMNQAEIASRSARNDSNESIQCFSKSIDIHTLEQFKLQARLKGALERDELLLYYQPKVDATSEQVVGYEALIRWIDSDQTLISPADFIPLAEESGGIIPIGEWVIWSACEHLSQLQTKPGKTPKISINLSSQQFQQPNLVELVQQALTLFGVNPALLDIEVTESVVMSDVKSSIDTLNKLKALGISISIDDFGTGYSSLSYLKQFPIDTLKVDRSFITDITTNKQDESITRAIIALAKSLELETVAEGVETREQLEMLREMGCDLIQGFLFGKPLSAEEAFHD